jgi:hypothetical protein
MHANLGTHQGNIHAAPDLTEDIKILMDSLARNHVYEVVQDPENPRLFENDDKPILDAYTVGFTALTSGVKSPLEAHNKTFLTLQERRLMTPLSKAGAEPTVTDSRRSQNTNTHNHGMLSYDMFECALAFAHYNSVPETSEGSDNDAVDGIFEFQSGEHEDVTLELISAGDVVLDIDFDRNDEVEYEREDIGFGTDHELE